MSRRHRFGRFWSMALVPAIAACAGEGTDAPDSTEEMDVAAPITVSGVGFSTPESVLHDTEADVYLVSNINGAPLDEDGNGFISRLSPEGEVLELKWIDGEVEGVTLSAPKGMAIQDGTLWVTDIDCVRMFDAASGAATGEVCVEGASFLNDLAPHPEGGVILTDMGRDASFQPAGTDAVYHLRDGELAPIYQGDDLGGPNGVAVSDGGVSVVTFFGGEIFQLDERGTRTDVMAVEGAQFDGVEVLSDGSLLVSDWGASCVHRVTPAGEATCVVAEVEGPADIGVDVQRNRVLIPLFMANEVWIRPIG